MTDRSAPRDPLQGLDPYPRERLEGLHAERADLLEEIVSTPGPGKQPTSRTRVLIGGGIAAALVVVGGGVWFATGSDDSATDDAPVAAASSATPEETEPDQATDPADPADEATEPDQADDVRVRGVQVGDLEDFLRVRPGDVLDPGVCRELRSGWRVSPDGKVLLRGDTELRIVPRRGDGEIRLRTLREGLTRLSELKRLPRSARAYYVDGPRGGWVAIDGDCTVVDRGRGPWIDVYLRTDRRD